MARLPWLVVQCGDDYAHDVIVAAFQAAAEAMRFAADQIYMADLLKLPWTFSVVEV